MLFCLQFYLFSFTIADADYSRVSTVLTFDPASTGYVLTATVPITSDDIVEEKEEFRVQLSLPGNRSGVELDQSVATVEIEDSSMYECCIYL